MLHTLFFVFVIVHKFFWLSVSQIEIDKARPCFSTGPSLSATYRCHIAKAELSKQKITETNTTYALWSWILQLHSKRV